MSNASLLVKFRDGLILFGQYHGTSDICNPNLFDSLDEAWSHKRNTVDGSIALDRKKEEFPESEKVDIFTNYGGGWYWGSHACRKTKQIVGDRCGYWDEIICSFFKEEDRKLMFEDDWAKQYFESII